MMCRVEEHRLRSISQQQFLELVDVGTRDVPADEARAGRAETVDRAEISRPLDDDGIARVDEAADQQVEPLLRAGNHEDVFRPSPEPRGNGFPESPLAFGG